MFENINSIVNIIIALAALLIAYFQYKDQRMKKREEMKKETLIRDIISECSSIYGIKDEIEKSFRILSDVEKNSTERVSKYLPEVQNILVHIKDFDKTLKNVYSELVKNESMFSLSYGYGRYIDAFRIYLSKDMAGKSAEIVFKLFDSMKHDQSKCDKLFESLVDSMNENYTEIKKLIPYIDEIRIRYGNYN